MAPRSVRRVNRPGLALTLTLIGMMVVAVASSCGDPNRTSATQTTSSGGISGSIVVSAAASLTGALGEIGTAFHAVNKNATVTFNFGASSALATQIIGGAPADVFASADEENVAKLTSARLVAGTPKVFARNSLTIITKPGNPENIRSLTDLANAGVISLCGSDVPCGKYAEAALAHADVKIAESSVTRGQNATATLGAVADGDAVAGIVYVTDAKANAKTTAVAIPTADNVIARYPVARLSRARDSAAARAFVAFLFSKPGQRVLRSFGFLPAG